MASLGELLQRVARSLEEASEQGPADDLRARLGYGAGDEDDDGLLEDPFREPAAETSRPEPTERESKPRTAPPPPTGRRPETVWRPPASGTPASSGAGARGYGSMRPPPAEAPPRHPRFSPSAPPSTPVAAGVPFPQRIRARLRSPDALREAFVVKEILDQPLTRRRRGSGIR
ncbi:MAG: hypothetical protein OXC65_11655 [Thiotrichales bacterium]|nr:hypothetical protein [Thiotrichales bacterium]